MVAVALLQLQSADKAAVSLNVTKMRWMEPHENVIPKSQALNSSFQVYGEVQVFPPSTVASNFLKSSEQKVAADLVPVMVYLGP